jgi:hypothetical protein
VYLGLEEMQEILVIVEMLDRAIQEILVIVEIGPVV